MADRRKRGPVPAHTREAIAAEAVRLADGEGLAAVTMRRLAGRFETGGGSLYRYVSSRDDLLDLMVDAATGELSLSPAGGADWRSDLLDVGHALLDLYRAHPWLADVRQRAATPGPNVVAYFEHCLRVLAPVDADSGTKMEAIALLVGVVTLFAQAEAMATAFDLHVSEDAGRPLLSAALDAAPPAAGIRPALFDRAVTGLMDGVLGL